MGIANREGGDHSNRQAKRLLGCYQAVTEVTFINGYKNKVAVRVT